MMPLLPHVVALVSSTSYVITGELKRLDIT
jgi:hypothetical protein